MAPPADSPPNVDFTVTGNFYVGQIIRIDPTASSDDGTIKETIIQPGTIDEDGVAVEFRSKKPTVIEYIYEFDDNYTITVILRDNKGLIASKSMSIAILRIGANITLDNQSISVGSPDGNPVAVTYPAPPTPSGGVPPYSPVQYSIPDGSLFPVGTTNVTMGVVDSIGNIGAANLAIEVVDNTPPPIPPDTPLVVTAPSNISGASPDGNPISLAWGAPTISGGTAPYTTVFKIAGNVVTSPQDFPIGITTINIFVTDDNGVQNNTAFLTASVQDASVPVGSHEYFDQLVARPECISSRSFRNQAQINSMTAQPPNTYFTYPPSRFDPTAVDGMQFYIEPTATSPGASVPGVQQVRWNLPVVTSGVIILIWDWLWNDDFYTQQGATPNYKTFQTEINGHQWWTYMNSPGGGWSRTFPEVAAITDELNSRALPAGMSRSERVTPAGPNCPTQYPSYNTCYQIDGGIWNRYITEIRLYQPASAFTVWNATYNVTVQANPNTANGLWHMISHWIIPQNGAPQRIVYRAPMDYGGPLGTWAGQLTRMRFEMNTSKKSFIGPWIGYGRDGIMFWNYILPDVNPESDPLIFRAPLAG